MAGNSSRGLRFLAPCNDHSLRAESAAAFTCKSLQRKQTATINVTVKCLWLGFQLIVSELSGRHSGTATAKSDENTERLSETVTRSLDDACVSGLSRLVFSAQERRQ